MATNDFLVFDESGTNQMSQADYAANIQRTEGVVQGIASAAFHNKIYHQASFMGAMLGQFIADAGYPASDVDLAQLQSYFEEALRQNMNPASNTQPGVIRIATDAEATAQTLETVAINPKNAVLAIPTATQTIAGKVRIANEAEIDAGTSDTLAVSPLKLKGNYLPLAGGDVTGRVRRTASGGDISIAQFTNSTISLVPPSNSQGLNGDVWYQLD